MPTPIRRVGRATTAPTSPRTRAATTYSTTSGSRRSPAISRRKTALSQRSTAVGAPAGTPTRFTNAARAPGPPPSRRRHRRRRLHRRPRRRCLRHRLRRPGRSSRRSRPRSRPRRRCLRHRPPPSKWRTWRGATYSLPSSARPARSSTSSTRPTRRASSMPRTPRARRRDSTKTASGTARSALGGRGCSWTHRGRPTWQ